MLRNLSIKNKLILITTLTTTLALLLACFAFLLYDRSTYKTSMIDSLRTQGVVVGQASAQAMSKYDRQSAREILNSVKGMPNITNGFILVATRVGNEWRVRPLPTMPVSIYSLREARDERLGAAIGKMMLSGKLMKVTRLRRDPHDVADTCVLHATTTCLTSDSQE